MLADRTLVAAHDRTIAPASSASHQDDEPEQDERNQRGDQPEGHRWDPDPHDGQGCRPSDLRTPLADADRDVERPSGAR